MQPWGAEETSLKNITSLTDPKLLNGSVYIYKHNILEVIGYVLSCFWASQQNGLFL